MNQKGNERRKSDTNISAKAVSRRPCRHSTTSVPERNRIVITNYGSIESSGTTRRLTHPFQLRTSSTFKQAVFTQASGKYSKCGFLTENTVGLQPARSTEELPNLSTVKTRTQSKSPISKGERHEPQFSLVPEPNTVGLPKVDQVEMGKRPRSPFNLIDYIKQGTTLEGNEYLPEINIAENVEELELHKKHKDELEDKGMEPRKRRVSKEVRFNKSRSDFVSSGDKAQDERKTTDETRTTSETAEFLKTDDTTNTNVTFATTNDTGRQHIYEKVKTFLSKPQPLKGPRSLRTMKAFKLVDFDKESLHWNKTEVKKDRKIINTNTCPDMCLFDERKWYYQNKSGKCRYLRVPETPIPPVESIFDVLHGKQD